jgi:hypothetical protein
MKRITRLLVVASMLSSTLAAADDQAIEHYITAETALLETQVTELRLATDLLSQPGLTEADKFERIGQPSFDAVDQSLATFGFTPKQFYQFRDEQQVAIDQWLTDHPPEAVRMQSLQAERDALSDSYDQLNNAY